MEYTITVSNLGNIDAIVDTVTLTEGNNSDILYKVVGIKQGNELKATKSIDFKVIVEYDKNATVLTQGLENALININFVQQHGSSIQTNNYLSSDDLKALAITNGDGLYIDDTEQGRYIYRGLNPNNYITFNNEEWRIISIEDDKTIKIVKDESLGKMPWDADNTRSSSTSTYCKRASNGGCNAWVATNNLVGQPSQFVQYSQKGGTEISGTVIQDSSLNTYLNGTYYNGIGTEKNILKSMIFM